MTITNIDSWPYHVALTFVCGGFIFTFVYIGISIYISKKYLPILLDSLPNSPCARSTSRNINQKSLTSKALAFSLIAGHVLFKKSFIRNGYLCQSDMKSFPKKLEKIIRLEFIFSIITFIWMALIGILFKLQEGNTA